MIGRTLFDGKIGLIFKCQSISADVRFQSNGKLFSVHKNTIFNENETVHSFYQKVINRELTQEYIILTLLTCFLDLDHSSTYARGQGSVCHLLVRTLANLAGYRMTYVGKWHVNSPLYPPVMDTMLEADVNKFIEENQQNILLEPLAKETKEGLELYGVKEETEDEG